LSAASHTEATDDAWWLGAAVLCAVACATVRQLQRGPTRGKQLPDARHKEAECAMPATPPDCQPDWRHQASRMFHGASAVLATSVLADSGLEHYRGQFSNPGMFASLLGAGMTLAVASRRVFDSRDALPGRRHRAYQWALLAGLAGTGFHFYNVGRRLGGFNWGNVFYGAPLGAPSALALAGLIGLAADKLADPGERETVGRLLCVLAGAGLAGTSAEAGLLHFRGAFHNPFMWVPVSVPPIGAALLGAAAIAPPAARRSRLSRAWMALTGTLGLAGVGFHAFGVARRMGGWRNWTQNLQAGPPLPAPPAFSALALAGYAALQVLERESAP